MASWHHTLNKNKSTFSAEKISAVTRSMDTWFDQINEKINKNHEELHEKIKQTSEDQKNSFLTLQEDQNKNQAVLTAILDRLQILNDLQPNSTRTTEQSDPLFNMSSSNAYTQGRQIRVKVELQKYDGDEW